MAMKEIGMLKRVAIVVVMCFAVGIGFVGYSADKQSAEQSASLFEAAAKNNALDAQRFINEGIDVNAKGDYGKTALMYAAECNSVDVAKLLIKAKADVNAKDIEEKTALMYTVEYNSADVAELLIKAKVGVNAKGDYGETALMYAAVCNSVDVAKLLIKAKADVNAKDIEGKTALMYTAEYNSADVAELLIKAKADINTKDNDGKTALMYTPYHDAAADVAELLIKAKADVNAKDIEGKTALKYAMDGGYPDIVQLIKEANTKGAKQKNKKAELSLDDMIDKFMKNGAYVKEYDRNTVSYVQKSTLNGIEITKTRVKFYTGPHSLEFNSSKDRISLDKNNNLIIIKQ